MHVDTPPGADKAMSESDMADPRKRGFYLATIGHCMECHTPLVNDRHDNAQLGKGGQSVPGALGCNGFAQYHVARDGRTWRDGAIPSQGSDHRRVSAGTVPKLKPPMQFPLYATMTEQDLSAIVAYLRTVPPKE